MTAALTATRSPRATIEINYRKAIAHALAAEMRLDERVVVLGEDVAAAGGVFKTTAGLWEEFGSRVRDTPIAEQAIVGLATGAAVAGLRPVAEIMFADFAAVAFDQIANALAKLRYMSGGQLGAPVTLRLANGAGGGFGSQHSQPVENWFLNVPGIKIAVPGTPEDVYGLLRSAIRDEDPVLVFEHKALFELKGRLPVRPDDASLVPLGQACVVAPGDDITIVAIQAMRQRAVLAREWLGAAGISAEVLDLRSLVPLDVATVLASLRKTSRLLVVQEGSVVGSWGASLVTTVVEEGFELLDAPPRLVSSPATPVPYSQVLESAWLPTTEAICSAAAELCRY